MFQDLQRIFIGLNFVVGVGFLVNLFFDEYMNLVLLLCWLILYVMVRFVINIQWLVLIYIFDVFFRSVEVFDEIFCFYMVSDL